MHLMFVYATRLGFLRVKEVGSFCCQIGEIAILGRLRNRRRFGRLRNRRRFFLSAEDRRKLKPFFV